MFQILPCPACQTFLKLPTNWLSSKSEVELRCPGCGKNVSLQTLLSESFPSWELISGGADLVDEGTASVVPPQSSNDAGAASPPQYQPSSLEDGEDLELVSESDSSTTVTQPKKQIDWSSFEPITHEQFERMKRKQKSPIWSMLQVVLGGFLAIPIAILILWYGLGRDVGDAGPTVAKYAPWIVPKKFQGRSAANTRPRPVEDANRLKSSDTRIESSSPSGTDLEGGRADRIDNEVVIEETTESLGEEDASNSSAMNNELLPGESVSASGEPTDSDSPRLDLPPIDLRTENVLRMIRECEKDLKLWNESTSGEIDGQSPPPAEIRELAQRCYSQLQALTNTITPIPKTQPYLQTIRTEMGGIGRSVKNMESVQELVQKGSQYWLSKSTDGGVYPLAIIVEIERVEFADGVWTAVAKGDMSNLDIRVSRSLSAYMSAGQRLFMMGNVRRAANLDPIVESDQQPPAAPLEVELEESPKPLTFVAEYLHAM